MIRSSKHLLAYTNSKKLVSLKSFVNEYRRVSQIIVEGIWDNGYDGFVPDKDELDCPMYLDYNRFKIDTSLSARAMSSLTTQLCGMLKASTKKRSQLLWVRNKLQTEGKSTKSIDKAIEKNKYKSFKPSCLNLNPELSSKCCDIQKDDRTFQYFLRIKSIGESFGHIKIPLKDTVVSKKWKLRGDLMNSFLISETKITLRFDVKSKNINTGQVVVSVDQGVTDLCVMSDRQKTPEKDIHGHSMKSIMHKLARKKNGSNAFKKAQDHRKNFINWSINQLDLSNVREVKFEKVWNIGFKRRRSRWLSRWTNTLIRDKFARRCEEMEVPFTEVDSAYFSQRCFSCGLVRKSNRKGKQFKCGGCGYEADADFNSTDNHLLSLPKIDWKFRQQRHNLGEGFYWKPEGIFAVDGSELRVPITLEG